jgi:hypothetical protein
MHFHCLKFVGLPFNTTWLSEQNTGENEEEPTPGPVTPPIPGPTQATGLEPVIEVKRHQESLTEI